MTALGGVSLFVRAVSSPFVRSQRREDLNKGWRAFAHGEVLTLRLIQLKNRLRRVTHHSEKETRPRKP